MEQYLKKYFWIVEVSFVALCALLLAAAATRFASTRLAPYTVAYPPAPTAAATAAAATESDSSSAISSAFAKPEGEEEAKPDLCAAVTCMETEKCNPETGRCEPLPPTEPEGPADGNCLQSDIQLTLVGTMVADDPEWSVAVLKNPSVNQTQFATVGSRLLAEADVTRIERNRVFILRNGREECMKPAGLGQPPGAGRPNAALGRINAPAAGTPAAPGTAVAAGSDGRAEAVAAANGSIEQRILSGVQRQDDGSYQVDRTVVQEIANNQAVLEAQAPRVVPNYVNGQPDGFRLQSIRSGTIFSAIGVRNGDVIRAVNGTKIDSPQRALELYQSMLREDQVRVEIMRRGREETLTYNIK